jgi:hypothetical protein
LVNIHHQSWIPNTASNIPKSVYVSHRANRSFFVCPFVYEKTNGSNPFANGLNVQNELNGLNKLYGLNELNRLNEQTDLPIYGFSWII